MQSLLPPITILWVHLSVPIHSLNFCNDLREPLLVISPACIKISHSGKFFDSYPWVSEMRRHFNYFERFSSYYIKKRTEIVNF